MGSAVQMQFERRAVHRQRFSVRPSHTTPGACALIWSDFPMGLARFIEQPR